MVYLRKIISLYQLHLGKVLVLTDLFVQLLRLRTRFFGVCFIRHKLNLVGLFLRNICEKSIGFMPWLVLHYVLVEKASAIVFTNP